MLDIAALQHLYGADFTTNAGDTTYSWSPGTGATSVDGAVAIAPAGNRVFLTLWDGGGSDTYDLSAYAADLAIDLRPGQHSTFAAGQLADLGGGPNGGHARGNLFNALQYHGDPRSLIENARGGSGDDLIRGNGAKNQLAGNAGDDRLIGLAGADRLLGGDGADFLLGGAGADTLTGGAGRDRFEFAATLESPSEAACDVLAGFDAPGRAKGDLDRPLRASTPAPAATATRPSSSAAAARATCASSTAGTTPSSAPTPAAAPPTTSCSASPTATPARPTSPATTSSSSRPPSPPADQILLPPLALRLRHQRVPGLAAEMREVDPRRRVVRQHPQHRARRQRPEALARLQHRQRAEQPAGVELGVPGHGADLAAPPAACPRQCARAAR